jgi:hypothetical protein
MDSNNIYQYILNLEIENTKLKNDYNILKNNNNELINELADFKKVSIMVNINKQLKEKENQVTFLQNQVRNLKSKINTETPVIEIPVIETPVLEIPVIETPVIETSVMEIPVIETPVMEIPVIETPVIETKKISKKKVKEYQIIKYKNKDYLLNLESNEIFESDDIKLHNKIGILSKGKIKFNG